MTSTEPDLIKSSNFPRGYAGMRVRQIKDTPIEAHLNHDPTGNRRDNRWHLQANDQKLTYHPTFNPTKTNLGIDAWDKSVIAPSSFDSWCQTLPYHLVTGDLNKVDCKTCLLVLKRAIMLEEALRSHLRSVRICPMCNEPNADREPNDGLCIPHHTCKNTTPGGTSY